jgi:hypothetical protein
LCAPNSRAGSTRRPLGIRIGFSGRPEQMYRVSGPTNQYGHSLAPGSSRIFCGYRIVVRKERAPAKRRPLAVPDVAYPPPISVGFEALSYEHHSTLPDWASDVERLIELFREG